MGLLSEATKSWNEAPYQSAHIGCQWELYGLKEQENYPLFMNYSVTVQSSNGTADWWRDWQFNVTNGCKYNPDGFVESSLNQQQTVQIGEFDLYYDSN